LSRQLLSFFEYFEDFMVREDLDVMGGAFEVMMPFFESLDDSKKFSIIDIIISFGFNE